MNYIESIGIKPGVKISWRFCDEEDNKIYEGVIDFYNVFSVFLVNNAGKPRPCINCPIWIEK